MSTPQPAIFVEGSPQHLYLEYEIDQAADAAATRAAIGAALGIAKALPSANVVIAFGPALWSNLSAASPEFTAFQTVEGVDGHTAPSTQRDLFVWIHGVALDDVLDCGLGIGRALESVGRLALDERGFTYHDQRDLTGFIDGSANPKDQAARQAALVPEGQNGAGGAYVLSQRWLHDLEKFNDLPVEVQEKVIGRTKADSIEFEGDAMPEDSHVSRTDVDVDGVAQKIYRRSAPFGKVGIHGLYFLAFACDQYRFDIQLQRMFGLAGDGLHDRLIEYSIPDTGSYWFAPAHEDLVATFG